MSTIDKLCQIEIPSTDIPSSIKFYSEILGWRPVPIEIHQYTVLETPADSPYGISLIPSSQPTNHGPTLYFKLGNDDLPLDRVKSCGGQIVSQNLKLAGYGSVTILKDPSGNRLGLFRAK